jgi:ribosome recycling factor
MDMSLEELTLEAEEKMEKVVAAFASNLQTIRTGRANPAIVDKIRLDYFGTPTPLKGVATLSVPEARVLAIDPWDKKMIPEIEKALRASDIGINPVNNGVLIRLVMPEMTEERRRDLTKIIKGKAEESRVSIRNVRRDYNAQLKKMEKDKEITEDDNRNQQKVIQDLTDEYIKKVDQVLEHKEKEIMTV